MTPAPAPSVAENVAFVFATDQDTFTRYTAPSAWEVSRHLIGRPDFHSVSFLPMVELTTNNLNLNASTTSSLHETEYLQLGNEYNCLLQGLQLRLNATDILRRFRLGFGSAHGDRAGLMRLAIHCTNNLIFDEQHCQHLDGAILVLASCMTFDEFPTRMLNLPGNPVRAVIAYSPKLWVPLPATIRYWGCQAYHQFKTHYIAALIQPVISLLQGRTVSAALEETRLRWTEASGSCPELLAQRIAAVNAANITSWPPNSNETL